MLSINGISFIAAKFSPQRMVSSIDKTKHGQIISIVKRAVGTYGFALKGKSLIY
jgi:hypothetical protein